MLLTLYLICQFLGIPAKKKYEVKHTDKWGYNYLIEQITLWEKETLLVTSNFSFSDKAFKSFLVLMRQNDYLWSKGLSEPLASLITFFRMSLKNYITTVNEVRFFIT